MFHATGDITTIDPLSLVRGISAIGFTGLLSLNLIAFWRRWVVTFAELEQLRTSMQKLVDDKDAALVRKDEQIEALQSGLIDKAIPALTRSTLVLEQIDNRARDEAFRQSGAR